MNPGPFNPQSKSLPTGHLFKQVRLISQKKVIKTRQFAENSPNTIRASRSEMKMENDQEHKFCK
jgi:hypothetical protein